MNNYDAWRLSTPEEHFERFYGTPVCECEQCENGLYRGQDAVRDEDTGFIFCSKECFDEFVSEQVSYITIGGDEQ